jgi:DNA polymerase (family X)
VEPPKYVVVARVLRDIAFFLRLRGESPWRIRAFDAAAGRVLELEDSVVQLARSGRLTDVPGIGEKLAALIAEIVNTGGARYHAQLRGAFPPGLGELSLVAGLGPHSIERLWRELGVADLEGLERACVEGRVRTLRGYGPKREASLLLAVREARERPTDRGMLAADAIVALEPLVARLRAPPGIAAAEITGEARRFVELVRRLEVLAAGPPEAAYAALSVAPEVRSLEQKHGELVCALFDSELPAHVRAVPPAVFGSALLEATGPREHLALLRERAARRGVRERLAADEATAYEALGLPFLAPELRDDPDLERAAALSSELVRVEDVRGNVHSHSDWSDGRHTLETMARAALDAGFDYLTVTDHSQAAHYAGGLAPDELLRQWELIDRLNDELRGIRLLKGIECDILADGALDLPVRVLERLDVVIGSVHQRHRLDEAAATARVLRAFDNPYMQIWGHPTGRLIDRRAPSPLRMDELIDAAAERGIAIEVNGSPDRLDLSDRWARYALSRGARLVVSTDAHSTRELAYVRWAIAVARRAGARRADVLNTLPAADFVRALRRRSRRAGGYIAERSTSS